MGFHARAQLRIDFSVDEVGDLTPYLNAANFNHSHWIRSRLISFNLPITPILPGSYLVIFSLARRPASVDAWSESVSHMEPRPQQSRLHVPLADIQDLSSFLNTQVLDVPQYKHLTIFRGKEIEGAFQGLPQLLPLQFLGRDLPPIGKILWERVPLIVGLLFVDGIVEVPAVLAAFQSRFIDGDLDKPGAELGFTAKTGEGGECLHDCFLHHFFRVGGIVQDGHCGRKNAALAGLDEAVEGVAVAGATHGDQFGFALLKMNYWCI